MKVTRSRSRGLVTVLVAAAGAAACQTDRPASAPQTTTNAQRPAEAKTAQSLRAAAAAQGGQVSSVDRRGVPQFIWGLGKQPAEPADTPVTAARYHLSRYAAAYGLKSSELDSAEPARVRTLRQGGVLAKVKQRVHGVAVYPSEVGVLMRSNLELVAISGNMRSTFGAHGASDFALTPEQALAAALGAHLGVTLADDQLVSLGAPRGDAQRFTLAPTAPVNMPEGQVRQIYWAGDQLLQPAYFVEFYAGRKDSSDSEAFRYILSARDGKVIERKNLTQSDAYQYRVWAEPNGRPLDGPIADYTPNPTGLPDGLLPAIIPSVLVSMEGFNTNPSGQVDPWLDANKTESNGNNVDAYSDYNAPDGYTNGDYRATTTSNEAFDRNYDVALDPLASVDQSMASVTNLFYINNWLHDWWYDSGFDEAAGNAQLDNFGRGGVGGDPLHAEAQDSVLAGNRNNANMSTPSDGFSPRMQMYSWTGQEHTLLHVTPANQDFNVGTAAFGPSAFDVTAQLVVANDGAGNPSDGCSAIQNNVTNRIVIIDRGTCTFVVKAANAQAAGAVGVIIANNRAGAAPGLGGSDPSIIIGTLSVSDVDGAALKLLADLPSTAHMSRYVDVDRDGSLDYTVVAHEWGHYLHHRLADCGAHQCAAMSEGWGDFNALHFMLRAGDNLDGAYAAAIYAVFTDPAASYFGIRRVPYSASPAFNALSFRHIADGEALPSTHPVNAFGDNSEVHNAGEVWASMLFSAYVALQRDAAVRGLPFDDARRRMGDYVVAGLQMTPRDATYTEARDAIIAAANAMNASDAQLIAAAFAARGAGSCAESPARDSQDLTGVVEAFDLRPSIQLGAITIDDSGKSCDHDGVLDAEERGHVTVQIGNASPIALASSTLTLTSSSAGVLFPGGTTLTIPAIDPYGIANVQLDIAVDPALAHLSTLTLGVRLDGPGSCQGTVTSTIVTRINYDETTGGSTLDDVESNRSAWTPQGEGSDVTWSRIEPARLDHAWFGLDLGGISDTNLESPTLQVSATAQFVIDFDHRYSFEADTTYWDGAVLEISSDDGATWQDITDYANVPYGGTITDISGNPLGTRMGFVGNNAAWPNRDHLTINLGTALAGRAVKIRFRVGTDGSVGFYGWEIDNIGFQGIDNAPFGSVVTDATQCPTPLVASAGPDQSDVMPGTAVILDASASISADNLPLTYTWTQIAGPSVQLINASSVRPVFVAPSLESGATLSFMVTVSDGTLTADDSITIVVLPVPAPVVIADAGSDLTAEPGQIVVLDGSRSQAASSVVVSYTWRQTAGTQVQLQDAASAVARFTAPYLATNETLTFELTVSDGTHTSVNTADVMVHGYALTADAGADQAVDAKVLVVLDATASRSSTNLPLTFSWRKVSGASSVTLDGADRAVAKFTAPDPASDETLVFEVTVSDGTRTAVDTVSIAVHAGVVPSVNADAGTDQTVDGGATVILNGTASYSSVGLPLTYAWTQLAGTSVDLSSSTNGAVSFVAPKPSDNETLTFKLTVSDGTRESTDTIDINVKKYVSPGVTADAGDDQIKNPGELVVLDASRSKSDGNLPITYAWTQKSGDTVRLSNASSVAPTFTAPSRYEVQTLVFQVEISDGSSSATDEVEVTVHAATKPAEDDGCTCVTSPDRGTASSALSLGVLAFGLFFARRRKR